MKSVLKTALIATFALSFASAFAWADESSSDNHQDTGVGQTSAPTGDTERNTASVQNNDAAAAPASDQDSNDNDTNNHHFSAPNRGNRF
jgi:hypothetical protein